MNGVRSLQAQAGCTSHKIRTTCSAYAYMRDYVSDAMEHS